MCGLSGHGKAYDVRVWAMGCRVCIGVQSMHRGAEHGRWWDARQQAQRACGMGFDAFMWLDCCRIGQESAHPTD
jgi:hypothetical protein